MVSSAKNVPPDNKPLEWQISDTPVDYIHAITEMEDRARKIYLGEAPEKVWLIEHPPLFTAGTSTKPEDLLTTSRFPIYQAGRGGQLTYHGPGQRVAYVMLNLAQRKKDVRCFVNALEEWIIRTLAAFNVKGERREGRVGIWVSRKNHKTTKREDKIGAIGVRIKRWVTLHGISINVNPNLSHFDDIVPCGISAHGVTSFEDLGQLTTMSEVDVILQKTFEECFGSGTSMQKDLNQSSGL